jgi:hypothetical protein
MELTRKIGERYLWVDALCIIQDSLDEQAQIGAMDSIYQNSLLTIVAASGEDSNAGLPGVIRDSRPGHPQQEVRTTAAGVQLFLEIPSPPSLALSKWNSRGWCFQEKLLSRRLLVFVDQQIFWHCNYTNWNEDMSTKIHRENKAVLKGLRLKDDIRGVTAQGGKIQNGIEKRRDGSTCVVRTGTFAAYISALEDFKARDLGRATDAINAFGGILKILSPWFQSEMLYGLPESILDCALLWQPVTPLIPNPERESFPSWSWAGWIGSIQYERPYMIDKQSQRQVEKDEAPEERVRPVVRWYKRNIETQRFDKVNGSGSGLRFSVDKYGEVPNTWTEYDWVDMTLKDQIEPLEGRPISSSHLRFWTNHAYFLLQPSVYGISLIQSPASQSVNSAVVGYIVLTEGKDPTSPNRPDDARGAAVELIVLSEAQFFGQPASLNNTKDKRKEHYPYVKHNSSEYTIRQWDIELGYKHGQYELYNVMLVQRTGPIWYRSGLGRIYKKGWHQADPKPKLITLG